MLPGRLLIVDDDPEVLLSGKLLLKRHFQLVETEVDPQRLPAKLKAQAYDLVLLDMNFSPGSTDGSEGVDWLARIGQLRPGLPVVAITAYGYVDMAVKAMKAGATDFVAKPWQNEKLLATAKAAFALSQSRREVDRLASTQRLLSDDLSQRSGALVTGPSPAMQQLMAVVSKVAPAEADVLILGENGTGKELIAREIHRRSGRAANPFIGVDLGALAESLFESELFGHRKGAFTGAESDRMGRFEAAQGGTLFLDEIGNLPLPAQAKLLTVLQQRTVTRLGSHEPIPLDIRLISATNQPLPEKVQAGSFRQDLYFRLNTVTLTLPPLRERREDLPLLTDHFVALFAQKYHKPGLKPSAATRQKLLAHPWPGNIRELRHAIERAVIMSERSKLQPEDFALETARRRSEPALPPSLNLAEHEERLVREALRRHEGNISQAAKSLGLTRAALYRRMQKFGL